MLSALHLTVLLLVRRFHGQAGRDMESACGQSLAMAGREWRKMTPRSPIATSASG